MNGFFQLYQYLGPAIALPLGYILWLGHYGGDHPSSGSGTTAATTASPWPRWRCRWYSPM